MIASRKPSWPISLATTSCTISCGMRSLVSTKPNTEAPARIMKSMAEVRLASSAEPQISRTPMVR
ncbi:hypothetical protein D3C83_211550 [compost metagenome]